LTWNGNNTTPRLVFNSAVAQPATPLSADITGANPFIAIFGVDPVSGQYLKVNGNASSTVAYGQTVAYSNLGFGTPPGSLSGSQYWLTCHALSEAIMWPNSIFNVGGALAVVEGYLAWKWNLVANLPVGHPYKNAAPPNGSYIIS
jgi:hypothetical protein